MLVASALLAPAPGEFRRFNVDGLEREALVYAPAKAKNAPVVFAFHGHGGSAQGAARSFRIHEHWPEAVVVYPHGLPTATMRDLEGRRRGWQNNAGVEGDRDLKFFDAMLEALVEEGAADPARVYAMGHSNGGRFTYLLWAKRGEKLAAVGPSAASGLSLKGLLKPKSVFVCAGEKDAIVPFDSQRRTIDAILGILEVGAKEGRTDGYLTVRPGVGDVELATYVHPGGHAYPSAASKPMVEFFKWHRLR